MDVSGKQLTVMFHVDDVMLIHLLPQVVTEYVKKLDSVYGQKDPLVVTHRKVHEYLGITLDFREKGRCAFT